MIEIKTKNFHFVIESSKDIEILESEIREIHRQKRQAIEDLETQERVNFSKLMEKEFQQWLAQKELGLVPEDKPSPDFERAVEEAFHDEENKDW